MKFLIVFVAAIAFAAAQQSVSLNQDTLGNYRLNVHTLEGTRSEERSADGSLHGTYTYTDEFGHLQSVEYISGVNGFQIVKSSVPVYLPLPVVDTPEVAHARALHLSQVEQQKAIVL